MIGAAALRRHTCAGAADAVRRTVRVAGWVHRRRDHGGRGLHRPARPLAASLQLVFHPEAAPEARAARAGSLSPEDVVSVDGRGRRPLGPRRSTRRIATGAVELRVDGPRDPVGGRPAAVLGGGRVPGGLRGAAADLPLPRHPPARGACGRWRCAPGRPGDAAGAGRRGLPRGRDARPHPLDPRGRARLPGAEPPAARLLVRAAAEPRSSSSSS